MANKTRDALREVFAFRWQPGKDLVVVLISWVLVVGALYTATVVVGAETGGGLPYFFLYAVLGATVFGLGLPLYWMVVVRKRPLADLGISMRWLGLSLALQLVFAVLQFSGAWKSIDLPQMEKVLPLITLALAIGFFEAVFWRGWVLLRLEEAFGLIPALLLGSALYAAYHIGYGMPMDEMIFLFFIGLMYAAAFRLTRNVFLLWPVLQPMGQLITLIKDGLDLPLLASLGFVEVLVVMVVLVWLAGRYAKKVRGAEGKVVEKKAAVPEGVR